jgi:dTDP-4-amino-4,6-dideoxygalactose transaminase
VPHAPWLDFSERLGIPVVIDAASCFEAIERDPRGTVGGVPTVLSFHATKSFSTAEGGCVMTTDPALAQRVWSALNFGFESSRDSAAASTNGKMSEYHAAIGLAELDGWTEKRASLHDVARKYRCAFDHECRSGRLWVAPDVAGCYALLEVASESASTRVRERLEAAGLDSRLWYGMGLQEQTHFRDSPQDALTVTRCLAPRCIGLPMAPDLTDEVICRVVRVVREAL